MTSNLTLQPNPRKQLFLPALGQSAPSNRLAGRKVLVIGAGQRKCDVADPPIGNGRAIALLTSREGASVMCVDNNAEALEGTCCAIREEGGAPFSFVADVSDAAAIPRIVEKAREAMGGLDGMVLVVGVTCGLPMDKLTAEAWDRDFAINLRSNMLFGQSALTHMDEGSSIVLISSISSLSAAGGNPGYEVSKAAQLALARSIAQAGQERGIRCNSLLLGLIDTPIGLSGSKRYPARLQRPLPFGRQGTAWEIAQTTLFLLSHDSSFVNAHAMVADGGITSGVGIRAPVSET